MSQGRIIDFSRWPRQDAAQETGRPVPYLDIFAARPKIDFLFSLGGKYELIARSTLQAIKGREKAGKSALGLALIVAALKGDFNGIAPARGDLQILWIDTEQDETTLSKKVVAALEMAEIPVTPEAYPNRLKVVPLRANTAAERLELTRLAIEENGPDFVFLDGILQFEPAFNDEEKSNKIIDALDALTAQYKCAIACVIHTNKKDDEPRGHLGAFLQQRSSQTFRVKKEGDTALISLPYNRFAPVPDFSFSFADDFKIAPAGDAIDRAKAETRARFAPFFQEAKRITAGELAGAYADVLGCSTRQAQREIKAATAAGVLFPSQEGRKVFYSYLFPAIEEDAEDEI